MPKYAVKVDTSYYHNGYDEIVVEAENKNKAKYKASKCFSGMSGKNFRYFLMLGRPIVERVSDDTPCFHKSFSDGNKERKMKLVYITMAKI